MIAECTVYVIDDDGAVRDAIRELLESVSLRVELFCSAQEFLDTRHSERPGCLILDIRMPGMNGLELLRQMSTRGDELPAIILTGHGDVPLAVRAMKLGAHDFIEKPFHDQELLDCVNRAMEHAERLQAERIARKRVEERMATLTAREREVMDLVLRGKHSKAIASDLGISSKTADNHRANILDKMRVENAVALVRMVLDPQAAL